MQVRYHRISVERQKVLQKSHSSTLRLKNFPERYVLQISHADCAMKARRTPMAGLCDVLDYS